MAGVGVRVVTDRAEIHRLLQARVDLDPVTGTVLGTIRDSLDRVADPWCATNEAGGLAVRSQPEFPALLDGSWPEGDHAGLAAALALVPGLVGVSGVAGVADSVAERLSSSVSVMALRLHRLDVLATPAAVDGSARTADPRDRDLVIGWYDAFGAESHAGPAEMEPLADRAIAGGGCWLWLDTQGIPVSLAARQPVVAGSARIGPVYTPPGLRGRGYGSAVTAIATQDILDDDAIPVLFTDLANPTSNKIYAALGYYPVEDRMDCRFEPVPDRG
jgi:predicted GNAT family acetyltransferase